MLKERLFEARKAKNYSREKLAELAGVSPSTITFLENGRNESSRYLVQIADALGVSAEWLTNGEDNHNEFKETATLEPYDNSDELKGDENIVFIKFIENLSVACGDGAFNDNYSEHRRLPFSLNSLRKYGVNDPSKAFVGIATGKSNEPAIPEGSSIGIDFGYTTIKSGEMYLLTIDGKEKLKRIEVLDEGRYLVVSLNPDKNLFPDEVYDQARISKEQFIVRGRLFWVSWMN